jgi:hypothetical protein
MAGLTRIKSDGIGDDCDLDGEGTLVLDSTNNRVGIGTSSPGRTLDVSGSIRSGGSTNPFIALNNETTEAYFEISGSETRISSGTSQPLLFRTGSDERMRIDSSGNVGIGTSSPARELEVASSSAQIRITDTDSASSGNCTLEFAFSGGRNGYVGYGGSNALYLWNELNSNVIFGTNNTERMRINSSGNVGIGTTNPGAKLEVKATSTPVIRLNQNDTYYAPIKLAGNDLEIRGSSGTIEFYNGADNGETSTEKMRIDSDGRVLIGTTSSGGAANSRLQVRQEGGSNVELIRSTSDIHPCRLRFTKSRGSEASPTVVSSGDTIGQIRFHGHDGADYGSTCAAIQAEIDGTPGSDDMPGRLVFQTTADGSPNPTERMRIDSSGALLIGSTTAGTHGELLKVEKQSTGTNGAGIKFGGTYSLADDATLSFGVNNACIVTIAENNTGDGGLFFCAWKSSTVVLLADPNGRYAASDTDGKVCVFKSANTGVVTLKNRTGATRSFTIGKLNTSD